MATIGEMMQRASLERAKTGFRDGYSSTVMPEVLAGKMAAAKTLGIDIEHAAELTPEQEAEAKAARLDYVDWQARTPVFLQRAGRSNNFVNLVKDDPLNTSIMESLAWKFADIPERNTLIGKSIMRGLYGAAQGVNAQQAGNYLKRKKWLEDVDADIAAGKSNMEIFGEENELKANTKRQVYDANREALWESVRQQGEKQAEDIAYTARVSQLFPQSAGMEAVSRAESFNEAVGALLSNPTTIAEFGIESLVQYAPAIPAIAAASLAGPAGAAAVTGAYSYWLDSNSTMAGMIAEGSGDPTDAKAVLNILNNANKMAEYEGKAARHALPVAIFDALSAGLAGKTLIPARYAAKLTPSGKRWAEFATQTPVQGAFGGAGEALGQIAAEGALKSWGDVVAEIAGEGFTAPIEVVTVRAKNYLEARQTQQEAEVRTNFIRESIQAVSNNKLMERAPDEATEFIRDVGEATGVRELNFDAQTLNQEGLDVAITNVMPGVAEKLRQAMIQGDSVSILMEDFAKLIKTDPTLADRLAPLASVKDFKPLSEAIKAVQQTEQDASTAVNDAVEAFDPRAVAELKAIKDKLYEDIKEVATADEAQASTALVTTLVANMAQDMGMTPQKWWQQFGIRGVFGVSDMEHKGQDIYVPHSEKAKQSMGDSAVVQRPGHVYGQYLTQTRSIIRWPNANKATFLHESGHWFLEAYLGSATQLMSATELTEGQKHILENTKALMKWFGVKDLATWNSMTTDQKRACHEKFARTYEAYLFEGKAPSKKLESVFRSFTRWLKKIYQVIAGIPGAEINPEVRTLFDSMFVASNAIEEAKGRRALYCALDRANKDAEFNEILALYQARDAEAKEKLTARLLRDAVALGRIRTQKLAGFRKEADAIREALRAEEWEKMKNEPKVRCYNILSAGEMRDGKMVKPKLVVVDLQKAGLTEEQINALDERNMLFREELLDDDGNVEEDPGQIPVQGDDFATQYGFNSYAEMATFMANVKSPTTAVLEVSEARMVLEHTAFASEKALQRQADVALHNEAFERALAAEVAYLENMQRTVDREAFREAARAQLSRMRLDELKPEKFRNQAEARARDALKAIKKGDMGAAALARRQQLYQTILAREATRINKNRDSFLKLAKKLAGKKDMKGMSTRYLIAAQGLINAAGIKVREGLLRDKVSLYEFLQTCAEENEKVPPIDPELESRFRGEFKSISVRDFEDLDDAVRMLVAFGKDARTIQLGQEMLELADVVEKCQASIVENAEAHGLTPKGDMEKTGRMSQVLNGLKQIGFAHARIQSVLKVLDGGKFGPLFDAIVRPTDAAATEETRLKHYFTKRMFDAFKPLFPKMGERAHWYEDAQVSMTRTQVIALALNFGNDGNRNRLSEGSRLWKEITQGRTLDEMQIKSIIEQTLSVEELEAVQKVWDVFEELRPMLQEQTKRLTGRSPKWVEARPVSFTLANGETVQLKGGYYPIMYDSRASDKGALLKIKDKAVTGASLQNISEHTYGGFLETRAKAVSGLAIALTTNAGFEGIDNVIHRLAWEETSINVWKVLKAVRPTIRDYYGADCARAIDLWMRANAQGQMVQSGPGDALARFFRQNVSLAGLGFNFTTAAIQVFGIVNSVPVIGQKWVARGMSRYLSMTPKKASAYVFEKSAMMEDRARTQFRELQDVSARASGNTSEMKDAFMRLAYKPIVVMQMVVDIPTWLGAYEKALSEGNTEQRAIAIADRCVIDAQGSGRASDLSAIERGGEWAKLMTVFYTFFNAILNSLVVSYKTKGKVQFAMDVLLVVAVQTAIETMFREGMKSVAREDDAEAWWKNVKEAYPKNVANFSLGMVVGLREISTMFDSRYSGPTGMRKAVDVRNLYTQVAQGEWDTAATKAAVNVMGSFFGLPATPINRAITGTQALREGKTDSWLAPFLGYSEQ